MVRLGLKATHKCSRVEGGFSGPSKVQGPVPKPNSVGCHRQINSSSLHKQTRMNPLGGDVSSPVENHDLVPSLPDNPKSRAYSRVPQCDGLPSIQSNKQNGHCIRRCSNRSVKWFTPHLDLFATHLNHKVPLYLSPVPDQHAWDIDAQNIIWSGLAAYVYPPTALLHRVIQNQVTQLPH